MFYGHGNQIKDSILLHDPLVILICSLCAPFRLLKFYLYAFLVFFITPYCVPSVLTSFLAILVIRPFFNLCQTWLWVFLSLQGCFRLVLLFPDLECCDLVSFVNELLAEGVESENMAASIQGVDHQDI